MGEIQHCAGMWSQWWCSVSLAWARRSQETLQTRGSTALLPAPPKRSQASSSPPANQGFSPTQDLRTGAPRLWLTSWTSLGQVSTEGHKSRFRCFSSLHYVCMFQSGLYRSSASFWLVFSENCSTCRCIFDVFTEGDELHTLLLCHRGLNSGKYTFLIYKVKVIIPFLTDYQYNKQCKEAMYLKYTVSSPYTASAIIANVVITIIIETT